MESTCATRAVKVLKYLRREVPATIPRSSVDELEQLPSGVLARLHTPSNWDEVTKDEQLRNWLAANPVPAPRAKVSGSLFDGTLVFVQLTFHVAGQPPSAMTMADVQTARDYADLAVIPIQRYVSQTGRAASASGPTSSRSPRTCRAALSPSRSSRHGVGTPGGCRRTVNDIAAGPECRRVGAVWRDGTTAAGEQR